MIRNILQIHAPSEKSEWKESRSGSVGIVIRFIDPDSGEEPTEIHGIDPCSDHNSHAWIWAATEAVRRLHWRGPDQILTLVGMHPHIQKQFAGRRILHGRWLEDFRELRREMKARFPKRWAYRHDPSIRRTAAFETALQLPHTDLMMRQTGRFIDWPDSLPAVEGPVRRTARDKEFDGLFA